MHAAAAAAVSGCTSGATDAAQRAHSEAQMVARTAAYVTPLIALGRGVGQIASCEADGRLVARTGAMRAKTSTSSLGEVWNTMHFFYLCILLRLQAVALV